MRIMLVCAGGMSTSILMNKIEKFAKESGEDILVKAFGVGDYIEDVKDYDVILLGPQISYKKDDILRESGKPVSLIQPMDYAVGNAANIIKLAKETIHK